MRLHVHPVGRPGSGKGGYRVKVQLRRPSGSDWDTVGTLHFGRVPDLAAYIHAARAGYHAVGVTCLVDLPPGAGLPAAPPAPAERDAAQEAARERVLARERERTAAEQAERLKAAQRAVRQAADDDEDDDDWDE